MTDRGSRFWAIASSVGLLGAVLLAQSAGSREVDASAKPSGESAESPAGEVWFVEEAGARGLEFTHDSGHSGGRFLFPEIHTGGAALFDAEGDGDLDAYLIQAGSLTGARSEREGNRLFINRGDGTFEDKTEGSGADDRGFGMGVTTGDYDGDGRVDLYVTNLGPNVLLRNLGSGPNGPRFEDVTAKAGVGAEGWGSSSVFVDYDRDGDLDLFTLNYINWTVAGEVDCFDATGKPDYCGPANYNSPAPDVLYRNRGDGTFEDVTASAGLSVSFGTGLGVASGDLDGDGRPDLFVANDNMLDQLWLNRGDGTFSEEAVFRGCAADSSGNPKAGMGVSVADVDDDGDLDLIVCNLAGGERLALHQRRWLLLRPNRRERPGRDLSCPDPIRYGLGGLRQRRCPRSLPVERHHRPPRSDLARLGSLRGAQPPDTRLARAPLLRGAAPRWDGEAAGRHESGRRVRRRGRRRRCGRSGGEP